MSEFGDRPLLPEPQRPQYTTAQVVMGILGTLLLFPGGCALLFALAGIADTVQRGRPDPLLGSLAGLWLFCFAISAIGIVMIRVARKRARERS